jgi:hypothetical protein
VPVVREDGLEVRLATLDSRADSRWEHPFPRTGRVLHAYGEDNHDHRAKAIECLRRSVVRRAMASERHAQFADDLPLHDVAEDMLLNDLVGQIRHFDRAHQLLIRPADAEGAIDQRVRAGASVKAGIEDVLPECAVGVAH